jgi:hypothetical protein
LALPSIPNTYRAYISFTAGSGAQKPFSTHVDYRKTTGGDTMTALGVAIAVDDALTAWIGSSYAAGTLNDAFTDDTQLDAITVYDLGSTSAAGIVTSGLPTWGDGGTDPLPPEVALVVSHRTATRGRSGRGRSYFAGFTEQTNVGGAPSPVLTSAMELAWQLEMLHIDYTGTDGLDQQVVSQATIPNVARQVVAIQVDDHWDTQRRRGIR